MNFRRGRVREEPEINLIPMIDVLLVILIFLMITTTYSKYNELQINLPQAADNAPGQAAAVSNVIDVAVDQGGNYLIDNKRVPWVDIESFAQELRHAAGDRKDPVIAISGDANATHAAVINVMQAANLAGYYHVSFVVQAPRAN